jgi:hypothetical protein
VLCVCVVLVVLCVCVVCAGGCVGDVGVGLVLVVL